VPADAAANEAGAGPRHGIPGMRERAELAGGAFAAEATEDGRFRVTARIPARSVA
jgi:signal transduction histidine kinase